MAASTPSHFHPAVRGEIVKWFEQYSLNERMEIEFRIQNVGEAGFERILSSLSEHRGWSNSPVKPMVSLDVMHASGVRETRIQNKPPEFLLKDKGFGELTMETDIGYKVRFSVAQEVPKSADSSPITMYRHKQRYTFVHKGLFKFELTRVKQGTSEQSAFQAPMSFEVELEFCGQASAVTREGQHEYLADSMLMKAADLLQRLSHAGRSADGSLTEGDEVVLAPSTPVELGPSGHGTEPRYGGEMPAELAERMGWLYSHKEADGRAYIMSQPTKGVGDREHFPLFYFCGTVPFAAVRRRT